MASLMWKLKIRIGTVYEEVTVSAATSYNARTLVEAQFGKGCIIVGPTPVR